MRNDIVSHIQCVIRPTTDPTSRSKRNSNKTAVAAQDCSRGASADADADAPSVAKRRRSRRCKLISRQEFGERFNKIKEHIAQFKTKEDLDVSENDLTPPETMSSNTDVSESEEEEHESEQKTKVAATRSNRVILKAQIPLGMKLHNENYADLMRKGLA